LEGDVCALDLLSKQISRYLGFPDKYHLIVEFDSERGKIKNEDYKKIIKTRDNIFSILARNEYINVEDPKMFLDKIKEFVTYLEMNQTPYFSHLGFGIVHPFFKDSEQDKRNDIRELMKKSDMKLGKFGIGITRKEFLDTFTEKIINRVKVRNDPFGKLNNGKIIDVEHLPNFRPKVQKQITGEELSAKRMLKEIYEPKPTQTTTQESKIEKPIQEKEIPSITKEPIKENITPNQKMNELIKETEKSEDKIQIQKKTELTKEEQEKVNKSFGGFGIKF
jgi:hypothetical protein